METNIVKGLLNAELYGKYHSTIPSDCFSRIGATYVDAIVKLHGQTPGGDLPLDTVSVFCKSSPGLTPANEQLIDTYAENLEKAAPQSEEVFSQFASRFVYNEQVRALAEVAVEGLSSKELDAPRARQLLDNIESGSTQGSLRETPADLSSFLELSHPDNLIPFNLPGAEEMLPGLAGGHNVIIFARPEVGKSSLTAQFVSGWLRQGPRVNYYGNEEPVWKIGLNVVRNALSMSDRELQDNKARHPERLAEWDVLQENLKLVDCVGMTLGDLRAHVKRTKPKFIVVDQADKVETGSADRYTHGVLKDIYASIRTIAKESDAITVNVSQAGADADGRRWLSYSMLDNSKTGKAGEADLIIGVGTDPGEANRNPMRYLCISKNKINGVHGQITTIFEHTRNQWSVAV